MNLAGIINGMIAHIQPITGNPDGMSAHSQGAAFRANPNRSWNVFLAVLSNQSYPVMVAFFFFSNLFLS